MNLHSNLSGDFDDQRDIEDICLWPDGFWCYREDLEEYGRSKSDDYEIVPYNSDRYWELQSEEG